MTRVQAIRKLCYIERQINKQLDELRELYESTDGYYDLAGDEANSLRDSIERLAELVQ